MGDDESGGPQVEFETEVPRELEGGVYSNFLRAWHTPYEFTLDFAAMQEAEAEDTADPGSPVKVRCPVVSRVRIPVTLIFRMIRTLNEQMTKYERAFGEIRSPEERE